ncbi:MAG: ribosome recycling factor family protein [Thalassotalea sp.]|nr:ribosome recycling factor family protein [Thalassotalea sp.]
MALSAPKTITLPSFLRKTMKAYALKSEIRALGCELSRVGRSRNWILKATISQVQDIIELIEASGEESWQWLAKLLKKQRESLTYDELIYIAQQNQGITVNQLVALTDCTSAQARRVIDEIEFM